MRERNALLGRFLLAAVIVSELACLAIVVAVIF